MSEQLRREDLDSMSVDEILQANREGRLDELKQEPATPQAVAAAAAEPEETPRFEPIFKDT